MLYGTKSCAFRQNQAAIRSYRRSHVLPQGNAKSAHLDSQGPPKDFAHIDCPGPQGAYALELQGYIKRSKDNPREWWTTLNGKTVSGSRPLRFARESVEKALASLGDRIKESNKDSGSPFKVDAAVAFGDFLLGQAQAQAADVGIWLVAGETKGGNIESSSSAERKRDFLRRLRARM